MLVEQTRFSLAFSLVLTGQFSVEPGFRCLTSEPSSDQRDVVIKHSDVRSFVAVRCPHRIRKQLATDTDIVPLGAGPFDE